jgi:hypothetical protein
VSGLHDEICLTRIGHACNCPAAAWVPSQRGKRANEIFHEEAAGFRGIPLLWRSRFADARNTLARWWRFIW